MKLINIVGARPTFIKIAPLIRAMEESNKRLRTSDFGHAFLVLLCFYSYELKGAMSYS